MFDKSFKNIDDTLRKDSGVGSELDYTEQTSWILFLKYLDDFEKERYSASRLTGKTYNYILDEQYRWESWAFPRGDDGKLDHNTALVGDDLTDFVNNSLFPYLQKFKSENPQTIEYKIGEIFTEIRNKINSGYNLREVINSIDQFRFETKEEKHEMTELYEEKLKNMGNAGRNGGEYYTPRSLIKTIVKVLDPKIGEKVYDGAVGSAGFLVEAYDHMKENPNLSTSDIEILQNSTFYGKEKKGLAYIIGVMNMILHGIESPNIVHTNTLTENIRDIEDKDRFDIVLANPPFGGKEDSNVQQNFPIKSSETAYLFLQHFVKILKAGGKAGIVIKNTFLNNNDNASVALRRLLLESCNLHTILNMPGGTFIGAGVKTVVLFFSKGEPTKKIWYYDFVPERNLGKTNPLSESHLENFIKLQKSKDESENSWNVKVSDLDKETLDLTISNPNTPEEAPLREPKEILKDIKSLDDESNSIINEISNLI